MILSLPDALITTRIANCGELGAQSILKYHRQAFAPCPENFIATFPTAKFANELREQSVKAGHNEKVNLLHKQMLTRSLAKPSVLFL